MGNSESSPERAPAPRAPTRRSNPSPSYSSSSSASWGRNSSPNYYTTGAAARDRARMREARGREMYHIVSFRRGNTNGEIHRWKGEAPYLVNLISDEAQTEDGVYFVLTHDILHKILRKYDSGDIFYYEIGGPEWVSEALDHVYDGDTVLYQNVSPDVYRQIYGRR